MNTRKIHYAWIVCAGCTLLIFCTGGLGLTGFTTYLPYLISIRGFVNTQVSTIIFIRSLFTVVGMTFVNRLIGKYDIRGLSVIAIDITAISFLIFGIFNNFFLCCVAAALGGMSYGLGGMIACSILITRWFKEHRGLAIGICMSATGMSAFVASPIITVMVESLSLRASFLIESLFVLISGMIIFKLIKNSPSSMGMETLGKEVKDKTQNYAEKTAAKPFIIAMAIGLFLLGGGSNNMTAHLSVLYQSVGFSSKHIAVIVSLFGLTLASGKCIYGLLSDKIGVFKACIVLYSAALLGGGLCCLARLTSVQLAYVAVMLLGLGLAVVTTATSAYAIEVSEKKDYPQIVSRFQEMQTIGGLVFAMMPGVLADLTGDYIVPYIIAYSIFMTGAIILQVFYKIIK